MRIRKSELKKLLSEAVAAPDDPTKYDYFNAARDIYEMYGRRTLDRGWESAAVVQYVKARKSFGMEWDRKKLYAEVVKHADEMEQRRIELEKNNFLFI